MSPELETLDQLQGGDLKLEIIAELYPSQEAFEQGVFGLLYCGDVLLKTVEGDEVPHWRWRELFVERGVREQLRNFKLGITQKGTTVTVTGAADPEGFACAVEP